MSEPSASGREYSVARGAVVVVAMRWTDRLIGFVSTLILARLLAPEDFGIIAMAMLVIGLIDVLLDLGVNVALIQNSNATADHYNTAWTLRIIQSVTAALIVVATAPLAADYFNDQRVVPVLWALGATLSIAGLENIGVVTFQKEMKFGLDFRFMFTKRIVGFVVTVVAAWLMRNYWALVVGMLSLRVCGVVLSYQMHPMRPRLSLVKLREIFAISQWMLVNSIGNYLNNSLHKMLVGRRATAAILGGYTLADEISAMPSSELLAPLNRVLFPAFVKAKDDMVELKRMFLLAQGVQTLIGIPAGVGLALVAEEAVHVLLGEQWALAVPFVQVLAVSNLVYTLSSSSAYLVITLGKVSMIALTSWAQVIVFVCAAVVVLPEADATVIVWLRFATLGVGLAAIFWVLFRVIDNLCLRDVGGVVVRPIVAAVAMSIALAQVDAAMQLPMLATLLIKIPLGAAVYAAVILLTWWLLKCPQGAELYLLEKVRGVLPARR